MDTEIEYFPPKADPSPAEKPDNAAARESSSASLREYNPGFRIKSGTTKGRR